MRALRMWPNTHFLKIKTTTFLEIFGLSLSSCGHIINLWKTAVFSDRQRCSQKMSSVSTQPNKLFADTPVRGEHWQKQFCLFFNLDSFKFPDPPEFAYKTFFLLFWENKHLRRSLQIYGKSTPTVTQPFFQESS